MLRISNTSALRAAVLRCSVALVVTISMTASPPQTSRLVLSADSGWKFLLGDPSGAEARSFDDTSWRNVDLPHDWSIEGPPAKDNPTGSGGGFFPAGTGWYRKTFSAPLAWNGKRVSVEFDGVYRDATVYLNGHKLGTHPYGYTSFRFDLTPHLDFSRRNVLAVRVDNSAQPNSRWYSGSGIYRHVRVVVTGLTHVAHWGVFVTTKQASTDDTATVSIRTRVANDANSPSRVSVETRIVDRTGKAIVSAKSDIEVNGGSESEATHEIAVAKPGLWSPESPALYRVVTRVLRGGEVIDEVETPFGIRTLAWSGANGLLLNGKPIKLAGGSVHHDNGPLGAMAFDRAEERRVQLLKGAGFNAVRTAHNPPSPAFLDACDRLGLLVLAEPFDTWKVSKVKFDYGRDFDERWKHDLSSMVRRDRNHPSIVIWGIGNEIPEAYTEKGAAIANEMATVVRSLDGTRPLTQAFPGTTSGPTQQGVFQSLDIVGYNYNLALNIAEDHNRAPSRIMLTTESYPGDAFEQWRLVKDNPFVIGEFVWTAMDYLGESGIGAWRFGTPAQAAAAEQKDKLASALKTLADQHFVGMLKGMEGVVAPPKGNMDRSVIPTLAFLFSGFPWHASNCGDLDLIGQRKPQSYYRDILWNGGDRVYATVRLPETEDKQIVAVGWAVYPSIPSWTWPVPQGKEMHVDVYSGAEKVQLFLNAKLIGEQPTGREQQHKATFAVPYEPGTLKAVATRVGRAVAESVLTTAGTPARLRLSAERTSVRADSQDLAFVTVEAVDSEGRWQPNADDEVQFSISGPGVIAAVGNGDGQDAAPFQSDRRKLFQGRALVVVRTSKRSGPIRLVASTPGLGSGTLTVAAQAVPLSDSLK